MKKLERKVQRLTSRIIESCLDYCVQTICDAIQQGVLKGKFSEDFMKRVSENKMKIVVKIASQGIIKKMAQKTAKPLVETMQPHLGESGSLVVKTLDVLTKSPNLITDAFKVATSDNKSKAAFKVVPALMVSMIPGIGGPLSIALRIGFSMISKKIYDKMSKVEEANFDMEKFIKAEVIPEIDKMTSWLVEFTKQVQSISKAQTDLVTKQVMLLMKKVSPKSKL